jgi:predicted acylesterase/phospholipase RssA
MGMNASSAHPPRRRGRDRRARHERRLPRGPRIGLALAGGGPLGAVYELGALRAIEESVEGLDLTGCVSYVGISAGALVGAALANGVSPSRLLRMLFRDEPGEPRFDTDAFFTPARREWARRALGAPRLLGEALWSLATRPGDRTLLGAAAMLAEALPVGLFDNDPIRRFVRALLTRRGRSDDFRRLARRLTIVAADVESGEPVRFGAAGHDHVPISVAVQASTAVPGIYPPVLVDGRHCADGALLKTMHASAVLEDDVDLLLCVNPLVPVDTRPGAGRGELRRHEVVERGLPGLLTQTIRTLLHSRLRASVAGYAARWPRTDVVLFEPGPDEYAMSFGDIFSFSARAEVAELAWRATRRDLLRRHDELAPMLARHGVRLRRDVLEDARRDFWTGIGLRPARRLAPVSRRLARALDEVELLAG